jgi:magnesium transporter
VIRVRCYSGEGVVDETIEPVHISERVADTGQLLWVDVEDPSPDDVAMLVREFEVHRLAADDLLERRQRPRLVQYPSHGVLYAKDVVVGPAGLEVRDLDVVFGDGWVVSLRRRSDGHHLTTQPPGAPPAEADPEEAQALSRAAEALRQPLSTEELARRFDRQRRADGVSDEGFFLAVLLELLVERYFDLTELVEERFDDLEEAVFAAERGDSGIERRLFRHRAILLQLRKAVSPLREAVAALARGEVTDFSDVAVIQLRDAHDNLVRLVEIVEAQRELLSGAIEANVAMISLRLNVLMKQLTSWGAILVAATLVTGVYGMNFEHMPELGWRFGYPLALAAIVAITGSLFVLFRRRDWL